MKLSRKEQARKRHGRIRNRVTGSTTRPRLAVYRSNRHIYAQVIDDVNQRTLVAASTLDADFKGSEDPDAASTQEAARVVGRLVAERAMAGGITQVVFDRGGKPYHGRVAALAEGAREAGLTF
ncbi:50S ribosomal protein L18 [Candidatus Cyanaurora vandensis]|uniref:50S ribosomal protein L18 n=1 Tax=Candidatus Cyanaurora vandensis TaxID=2714958 RepID=UPI00257B3CF7|nr:50S ribosomal protein L18 [Candidatus Cyanaurora vandensis]